MASSTGSGLSIPFQQQGTVDWVKLGKTGVTASVSILSRLSGANVDPFTISVAQALAGQFKLSRTGVARMNECLQSLEAFVSLDGAMWFGFGHKHIVRLLAGTAQGVSTLALCSSLSEVLMTERVAAILDELAATYGAPAELRPSLLQWAALVSNCSGVVSRTNFGLVAEHFISLDGMHILPPERRNRGFEILQGKPALPLPHMRDVGQSEDVAFALHEIGKVSLGSLISLELRGGSICGLLGAFAYWFLGLEIEIRKGMSVVHRSVSEGNTVQILVTYGAGDEDHSPHSLQVASRSYRICNIASILHTRSEDTMNDDLIMSGRIQWDQAIRDTFGSSGQNLLESGYHFCQILGSGARLLMAAARCEIDNLGKNSSYRNHFRLPDFGPTIIYNERSHGQGLINFMVLRLPELVTLDKTSIDKFLESPLARSHQEYKEAWRRLQMLCCCTYCRDETSDGAFQNDSFCLPLLAITIFCIACNLSMVVVHEGLFPSRAGLEYLYQKMCDLSRQKRGPPVAVTVGDRSTMLDVYTTAECIFTGRPAQVNKSNSLPAAYSANGMTFYLDILREFSDRPETAAMLHVVPGTIALASGRTYHMVGNSVRKYEIEEPVTNYQPLLSLPPPTPLLKQNGDGGLAVNLVVVETIRGAHVHFLFTTTRGNNNRDKQFLCSIGPTELLRNIASASYSVSCHRDRRLCIELEQPFTSIYTAEGEGKVDTKTDFDAGRLVVIRRFVQGAADPIARCIALCQLTSSVSTGYEIALELRSDSQNNETILRHENVIVKAYDECWSCCIKTALLGPRNWKNILDPKETQNVFGPKKSKNVLPVMYIL